MYTSHFVSAITAAALLGGSLAHAAASFTDIWFPDGDIDYFVEPDAWDYHDDIVEVMTYLSEYTPLDIEEMSGTGAANLHFEATFLSPDGGGYTYAYWDENRRDDNRKIRFDPVVAPSLQTIAHEFGHALGFSHEFQRDTRDSFVDVPFNIDPFNYAKLGSAYWPDPYYNLSPYDTASFMNYDSISTLPGVAQKDRDYDGEDNLLSPHDVNAIYRMHGNELGKNVVGDRFGVAVDSGDFDDDGFKDVVVAHVQNDELWLYFYRGIKPDLSESLTGLKWMPWFKAKHHSDIPDRDVTLATGDFNGDGIDDLALGQPGYDDGRGRVSLLFVNTLPSDANKAGTVYAERAPWGRKGIEYRIDLLAADYGLTGVHGGDGASGSGWVAVGGGAGSYYPRFGSSLAAVRATNYRNDSGDTLYHDLAIGAPFADNVVVFQQTPGAVVVIKGRRDISPSNFDVTDSVVLWGPDAHAEFGAAVSAVPGLCALPSQGSAYRNDFLGVGAPGYDGDSGAVHVYGCATSGTGSSLTQPPLLATRYSVTASGRFGHALAGFQIWDGAARRSYLAATEPYFVADSGLESGRVSVYRVDFGGSFSYETQFIPSNHDGDDEFGFAIAVQQRPFPGSDPKQGSNDTRLGIGMPGAIVDGHRAGKVYLWRPFNEDGSYNRSAAVVEAANPDADSRTRFGKTIAALRPLRNEGGFVAGAPRAITIGDGIKAGQVTTMQNAGDDFQWSLVRRNLNQETDGDKRPTN